MPIWPLSVTADQAAASEAAKLEMVQIFENGAVVGATPVVDAICLPTEYDLLGTNPLGKDFVEGIALALIRQISSMVAPLPAWSTPTLLNSWVNWGYPCSPARYAKDAAGRVQITGVLKDGINYAIIFVLPVGYWPTYDLFFTTDSGAGARTLTVNRSGEVRIESAGANTRVSIDCSFRIDQ
jgi:hypothetical protein